MSKEINSLKEFCARLVAQGEHKAELYDGLNDGPNGPRFSVDGALRFLTEEIGEVASAITRNRTELAKAECIDVAHCAFLVYLILNGQDDD